MPSEISNLRLLPCPKRVLALPGLVLLLLGSISSLGTSPAVAQDIPRIQINGPLLERLVTSAENSRWTWGTLRVQPTVGIGGFNYVDNVFVDSEVEAEAKNDINASIFAGLNIYQLLGDDIALAFHVRPSYSWWQDLDDRRRFNLNGGAALAVDLSRFFVDAELQRREEQGIVTEEAEQIINRRSDTLNFRAGYNIYRSLSLAIGYERAERENLLEDSPSELVPDFRRLDATTETRIAGVQAELWGTATVLLGYGERETTSPTTNRDFEGDGVLLEVNLDGPVISATSQISKFDYAPVGSSNFLPYDTVGGRLAVRFGPGDGRSVTLFGERGLEASVRSDQLDFESTRFGVSSTIPLERRISLVLAYFLGERDFRSDPRKDDTERYQAGLSIQLFEGVRLNARFEKSDLDSNIDQFDRDFNRFTVDFSIGIGGLTWP